MCGDSLIERDGAKGRGGGQRAAFPYLKESPIGEKTGHGFLKKGENRGWRIMRRHGGGRVVAVSAEHNREVSTPFANPGRPTGPCFDPERQAQGTQDARERGSGCQARGCRSRFIVRETTRHRRRVFVAI